MLQHRDIDIRLRPLYRFVLSNERDNVQYALRNRYENALVERFINKSPVPVVITSSDTVRLSDPDKVTDRIFSLPDGSGTEFLKRVPHGPG